ncbi:putative immunity protein, partial [Streptomyces sp. NPDC005009]
MTTGVLEAAPSEEDRRLLGPWAADCAERMLPLFRGEGSPDARTREAIENIRAYAHCRAASSSGIARIVGTVRGWLSWGF